MSQTLNTISNEHKINISTVDDSSKANKDHGFYDAAPLNAAENHPAAYARQSTPMTPMSPATPFAAYQRKNNLPAFLNKLYGMVSAPESNYWVHWSDAGDSFVIPDSQALADHVLGRHFKHRNFPSFVRQLNMYGFHKVPHLNHGILHNDGQPEMWEFTNVNFLRDDPSKMSFIQRKKGEAERARAAKLREGKEGSSSPAPWGPDTADVSMARAEIHSVAQRQDDIRSEVGRLAVSYDALFKYAMETRRRSEEQQDKLNRLISYLAKHLPRRSALELPHGVRGLLEGPIIEEVSEVASPAANPNGEHSQLGVMQMIASGKLPTGLQEAFQLYLQNSGNAATAGQQEPLSPTSPRSSHSPEHAAATYQMADNAEQLAKVQEWINSTDNTIAGLGIALDPATANADYSHYLNDPHLAYGYTGVDPSSEDILTADPTAIDANLQQWLSNYYTTGIQDTGGVAGQKRWLDDAGEASSAKKRRQ
jgi:HSF-type DNA-binding